MLKLILYVIIIYALVIMAARYDFDADNADYLIVLGSSLNKDMETFTLINRVNRAERYLKKNPDCLVIVSGGITGNNTISEAFKMQEMLIDRHITRNRIILEDKAQNTPENMKFSKQLLDVNKKITVCSSDYHIFRARLLARKYGYRVHAIFAPSMITDLIIRLPLEEYFVFKNLLSKN
ncbi:MAG: YdcF family protein [Erysipelotrichaceae bacterium]|nr:YdcF family protein [Erysipelotrichaceae bacterium]